MSITITPLEDIKEKEIKNIQINKNKMINPQIQKSINIKPLNKRNKLCRICYLEEENKYQVIVVNQFLQ